MARGTITVINMALNSGTVGAGTIDQTNGNAIAAGGYTEALVIHFDNTGDAGTISVLPGDNPPALTAGLGTLSVALGGTAETFLMLDGSRFCQDNGEIHLDFTSGMAGGLNAYRVKQSGIS